MNQLNQQHIELEKFVNYIESRSGLVFTPERLEDVQRVLEETLKVHQLPSVNQLIESLNNESVNFNELASYLTIGETSFFRVKDHFDFLRNNAIPELKIVRPANHRFSFWSAGCSTGEEAYSVAILLDQEKILDRSFIVGTDVSNRAIEGATSVSYTPWSFRQTDEEFQTKYFDKVGKRFVLKKFIKDCVSFDFVDLVSGVYPSLTRNLIEIDIIFCRNVLIYFNQRSIEIVAKKLYKTLAESGFLITAPADPPLDQYAPFKRVTTKFGYVYQKVSEKITIKNVSQKKVIEVLPLSQESNHFVRPEKTGPSNLSVDSIDPILLQAQTAFESGEYDKVTDLVIDILEVESAAELYLKACLNLKNISEIEETSKSIIEKHPLSLNLRFYRGLLLGNLGKTNDSIAAIRDVLYLENSNTIAHYYLATLLLKKNDDLGALKAFKNALAIAESLPKEAVLPLGEGQKAGRLAEISRNQIKILEGKKSEKDS